MVEPVLFSADSRVLRILRRIEARLRTVHPDNGYQLSIPTIERGKTNPLNFQLYPVVLIAPGNDVPEPRAHSVNHRIFTLTLIMWVARVPEISDALEQLKTNVQHAMMVDPRWTDTTGQTLAENTIEGPTQYMYVEGNNDEAGASIEYDVYYRTSIQDPTREP